MLSSRSIKSFTGVAVQVVCEARVYRRVQMEQLTNSLDASRVDGSSWKKLEDCQSKMGHNHPIGCVLSETDATTPYLNPG